MSARASSCLIWTRQPVCQPMFTYERSSQGGSSSISVMSNPWGSRFLSGISEREKQRPPSSHSQSQLSPPFPPHHHPPTLPPLLKHSSLLAPIRIEPQILPRNKRPNRHHIPDVPRHNVTNQHINIFLRQPNNLPPHINRRMHRISPSPKPILRRPHLRPPQPPARIANEVIPVTVSPGLRHNHPHPHSLPQKIQLRKLPHPLRRKLPPSPQRFLPRTLPPAPARPTTLVGRSHQVPNQHPHSHHPCPLCCNQEEFVIQNKPCHPERSEGPQRPQ